MDSSTYREAYKVDDGEYMSSWVDTHREIFVLPDDPTSDDHTEWPTFPDPVFQDDLLMAFAYGGLLQEKSPFQKLREFVQRVGDSEFAFASIPGGGREREYYAFPADVRWDQFKDDDWASPVYWATTCDHHLLGRDGQWGMYHTEVWPIYIVGCRDQETVGHLEAAFGFDDRNVALAEQYEPGDASIGRGVLEGIQEAADRIRHQLSE